MDEKLVKEFVYNRIFKNEMEQFDWLRDLNRKNKKYQ